MQIARLNFALKEGLITTSKMGRLRNMMITSKLFPQSNDRLKEENTALQEQTRDYTLLRKVIGSKQIDDMIAQAKEIQQAKRRQRQRSYER